jgi:hypothetical protein
MGLGEAGRKKKLISVHGPTQHSIAQLGMAWCLQEFLRLLVFLAGVMGVQWALIVF